MCVTDPWAHMSFMHSILSLKLDVTCMPINSSQTKELATTEDAYEVALKIEEKALALI